MHFYSSCLAQGPEADNSDALPGVSVLILGDQEESVVRTSHDPTNLNNESAAGETGVATAITDTGLPLDRPQSLIDIPHH